MAVHCWCCFAVLLFCCCCCCASKGRLLQFDVSALRSGMRYCVGAAGRINWGERFELAAGVKLAVGHR